MRLNNLLQLNLIWGNYLQFNIKSDDKGYTVYGSQKNVLLGNINTLLAFFKFMQNENLHDMEHFTD